ncbi:MAG: hypothetical protein ABIS92_16755, partial [Polyangia bacterium]
MPTRLLIVLVGGALGATLVTGVPVVTVVTVLGVAHAKSKAPPSAATCPDARQAEPRPGDAAQLWILPRTPVVGRPLRAFAVAEEAQGAAELMITPPGERRARSPAPTLRRGGAPWSYLASVTSPQPGRYTIELVRDGKSLSCRTVDVAAREVAATQGHRPAPGGTASRSGTGAGTWVASRAWDRATENFYSAWIESLFDAPVAETLGFRPLAQALRDPERNLFHDYLGLGEDAAKANSALTAAPDCADLPYFLRAYFSWKMGLPFGLRDCDRGTDARPPRCGELVTNETVVAGAPKEPLGAMKKFLRLLANKVHSGSGRTALGDENTDYYPVKLTRDT